MIALKETLAKTGGWLVAPAKPANQRGAARLGAVQALYQMDVGGAPLPAVIGEFEAHRLGSELEGEQLTARRRRLFSRARLRRR